MLVPISWLKDFVEIDVPVELLAERLTLAGLEVTGITYIGVPQTTPPDIRLPVSDHLVWDREAILLGAIREVKSHPDADRLVLAMVDYGGEELEQCVTGAPNLFEYKDQGPLDPPIWTAFAQEGAEVWDGHSDTPKRMTLKGKKLRGIYNKSMVCSEKELGISDEHEGIIILEHDPAYVAGTAMQDILGDVVLDLDLTPNLARCFSVIGVAREVAAILNKPMTYPDFSVTMEGDSIQGQVSILIEEPELNPRFTAALIKDVNLTDSPFLIQHRLKLVGQRPRNNIVDVTNYITFELGQPLHAFDYDKLLERTGGKAPTIITRLPKEGDELTTLDGEERTLEPYNILVCDTEGVLSLGGIIGGAETEINDNTKNVLLEAANWNFKNIRRTSRAQRVFTEAGTRFSRGVHPSQALLGVQRGIELMHEFGGGVIAEGIIDEYPEPPPQVTVDLPLQSINRLLGMEFALDEAVDILERLQFEVSVDDEIMQVTVPDFRMDIGEGVIGQADLIEEVARIHGYDHIPNTIMADEMPPQWSNLRYQQEETLRDVLVELGLRENISYRFTNPSTEQKLVPAGAKSSLPDAEYIYMENPISEDKNVLRHTLLANMLITASANARFSDRQQVFEVGKVYLKHEGNDFPDEIRKVGIVLLGNRQPESWQDADTGSLDFFDLKGIVEQLIAKLHIRGDVTYQRSTNTSFHPGRSADLLINEVSVGTFGEIHPLVAQNFKFGDAKVFAAEFEMDRLVKKSQRDFTVQPIPVTPAILEDIALVVNRDTPSVEVEMVVKRAGGKLLKNIQLFDVYQGDSIPEGKKSLAYNLVYQDNERTLTSKDVEKLRKKIIALTERELGAKLRD